MSPAINLAIAAAVAVLGFLLLRSQRGLLWKWSRSRKLAERAQIEDALKHCHGCEYEQRTPTLASLASALAIGRDEAANLATRLESLSLLTVGEQGLRLTPEGRSYALRVIRIHRLWEAFLADHTGVREAEWHQLADRREHTTTSVEAAWLSSQLGHPSFDPHGDPIPTAAGEMPARHGVSLTTLQPGDTARIVHVEDEPAVVYAQLVAARLTPGITVRVLESSPDRWRIEAEMQDHVLAPVVAANLTVEPIPAVCDEAPPGSRLSSLAVGDQATVIDISPACRGMERRRLLDLGVVPGTVIRAELRSVAGDPVAYRIRGAVIALRREQADLIHVRVHGEPHRR
jgi:DtxR family Mn-dependent transcriptional regulator